MSVEGDELIRKLRIALAETGYGDAPLVENQPPMPNGQPTVRNAGPLIPSEIWWRAWSLVGPQACWTCHQIGTDAQAFACEAGDCQAGPDTPKVPPKRVR